MVRILILGLFTNTVDLMSWRGNKNGTDHNVGILVEKFQKLLQAPEAAFKASAK